MSNVKEHMQTCLEEIGRKVSTGEVTGFVIVATTSVKYDLVHCVGEVPSPAGILTIQDLGVSLRNNYLSKNISEDDGSPHMAVVDPTAKGQEP